MAYQLFFYLVILAFSHTNLKQSEVFLAVWLNVHLLNHIPKIEPLFFKSVKMNK